MTRTEVTYRQLDDALRLLGFSRRLATGEPLANVYEHPKTGASFMLPAFQDSDLVLDYHLAGARKMLELFDIADPKNFDAQLQKAS